MLVKNKRCSRNGCWGLGRIWEKEGIRATEFPIRMQERFGRTDVAVPPHAATSAENEDKVGGKRLEI